MLVVIFKMDITDVVVVQKCKLTKQQLQDKDKKMCNYNDNERQ